MAKVTNMSVDAANVTLVSTAAFGHVESVGRGMENATYLTPPGVAGRNNSPAKKY